MRRESSLKQLLRFLVTSKTKLKKMRCFSPSCRIYNWLMEFRLQSYRHWNFGFTNCLGVSVCWTLLLVLPYTLLLWLLYSSCLLAHSLIGLWFGHILNSSSKPFLSFTLCFFVTCSFMNPSRFPFFFFPPCSAFSSFFVLIWFSPYYYVFLYTVSTHL